MCFVCVCVCVAAQGTEDWVQETHLPVPLTLRQALTHYLDITSPPTPQFLSLLAKQVIYMIIYGIKTIVDTIISVLCLLIDEQTD